MLELYNLLATYIWRTVLCVACSNVLLFVLMHKQYWSANRNAAILSWKCRAWLSSNRFWLSEDRIHVHDILCRLARWSRRSDDIFWPWVPPISVFSLRSRFLCQLSLRGLLHHTLGKWDLYISVFSVLTRGLCGRLPLGTWLYSSGALNKLDSSVGIACSS